MGLGHAMEGEKNNSALLVRRNLTVNELSTFSVVGSLGYGV